MGSADHQVKEIRQLLRRFWQGQKAVEVTFVNCTQDFVELSGLMRPKSESSTGYSSLTKKMLRPSQTSCWTFLANPPCQTWSMEVSGLYPDSIQTVFANHFEWTARRLHPAGGQQLQLRHSTQAKSALPIQDLWSDLDQALTGNSEMTVKIQYPNFTTSLRWLSLVRVLQQLTQDEESGDDRGKIDYQRDLHLPPGIAQEMTAFRLKILAFV